MDPAARAGWRGAVPPSPLNTVTRSARTSAVELPRCTGLYLETARFRVRPGVYAFCLFQNDII